MPVKAKKILKATELKPKLTKQFFSFLFLSPIIISAIKEKFKVIFNPCGRLFQLIVLCSDEIKLLSQNMTACSRR